MSKWNRKAVRAAVMLVPVFGLHLLFTIVRIDSNSAHQIINIAMDGLQVKVVLHQFIKSFIHLFILYLQKWKKICEFLRSSQVI